MNLKMRIIFCGALFLVLAAACTAPRRHVSPYTIADEHTPSIALQDRIVDVGCGQCLYGMDILACETAIQVDDIVYLAEGPGVPDAEDHGTGVCDRIQHARVSGKSVGPIFRATSFVMLP